MKKLALCLLIVGCAYSPHYHTVRDSYNTYSPVYAPTDTYSPTTITRTAPVYVPPPYVPPPPSPPEMTSAQRAALRKLISDGLEEYKKSEKKRPTKKTEPKTVQRGGKK